MMIAKPQRVMLLMTLSLITACNAGEPSRPVVETQTNEQGCVRVRSTGPQNPAAIPVPIKQACVGPYLLELPQNYFYNQMGTEFDGSFALALAYPSLEPFKPGERSNLSVDVSTRTIALTYDFVSKVDIRQAMRNSFTPMAGRESDPAASLEGRIKGADVYGLIPYYADLPRIRTHRLAAGFRPDAPVMQADWHVDWYIERGNDGNVDTLVKCTSREIRESGVDYREGKMVKKKGVPVPDCSHTFLIPEMSTMVTMRYARVGLPNWKLIESQARAVFLKNVRGNAQVTPEDRHKRDM